MHDIRKLGDFRCWNKLDGGLAYLWGTWRGKNSPNRATWLIWAIAPFVILAAQADARVGTQALLTFTAGFTPALIFLASFKNKKSFWKLGAIDYGCGVLSIFGLLLWLITKEGSLAIIFSIASDFLAAVPTAIKSYTNPETESGPPFLFNIVGAGITILTIESFSLESSAFAVYYLILATTLFVLIQFKVGPRLRVRKLENI